MSLTWYHYRQLNQQISSLTKVSTDSSVTCLDKYQLQSNLENIFALFLVILHKVEKTEVVVSAGLQQSFKLSYDQCSLHIDACQYFYNYINHFRMS